ncbi:MAG TPA: DUF4412 domain-containing protein [Bacillota bacterium]|nr:DUF4412 domain-containing protein [Bacillota bacterium]
MKRYLYLLLLSILLVSSLTVAAAVPENYEITYVTTNGEQQIIAKEKQYILDHNKIRVETIKEDAVSLVEIYRRDRKAVYNIYPASKLYSVVIVNLNYWESLLRGKPAAEWGKKTGETEYLGLVCDIYESKTEKRSSVVWVSREYGVCLKRIDKEEGKVTEQMEAQEFRLVKPDEALFELPKGYLDAAQYGD